MWTTPCHPRRLASPADGPLALGFIGTIVPHKGLHVVTAALRLLEHDGVRLLVYGDSFHEGGYERALRAEVAGDQRIEFRGGYDHRDLARLLAGLDAVVIPSVWHENLPTSAQNAIAAGVPVIGSDAPGVRELVEDMDAGFVFPLGDARALAELLRGRAGDRVALEAVRAQMKFPPSLEEEAAAVDAIYAQVTAVEAVAAAS